MVASAILDEVETLILMHMLAVPKARRRDPRWLLHNIQIENGSSATVRHISDLCVAAIDSLEG